jgi:small subunit ribosomal protein S11
MATVKKTSAPKKKKDIKIDSGVLHVQTTSNNTIITLVDLNGNKVIGNGTGKLGYKGSKKSTPYAAEVLTKQILKE